MPRRALLPRFPPGSASAGLGGMRGAADRCMNIGLCRKESTGVMCPSYMATRDEEHSTRGRANALLHAMSMPDPRAALGDDRVHGILDLCLECKACKSECPLGVDMAALKTEALAAYYEQHGTSGLRSRLFGSIRVLTGSARPRTRCPTCWPAGAAGPAGSRAAAGCERCPAAAAIRAPGPARLGTSGSRIRRCRRRRASSSSWPTPSPPLPMSRWAGQPLSCCSWARAGRSGWRTPELRPGQPVQGPDRPGPADGGRND